MMLFISGNAKVGKDEFCKHAISYFNSIGKTATRFALADELKKELHPFILSKLGIDCVNPTKEEKEIIRPILVAYGCAKRKQSNGLYWVNKVQELLEVCKSDVCIVTDIRFSEYACDETSWAKSNGKLIYITRYVDGIEVSPANEEERANDPKLRACADHFFSWGEISEDERKAKVYDFFEEFDKNSKFLD